MSIDILNLEARSKGRDIDIVEPILTYLEKKYNAAVSRDSIWYGEIKILLCRPKVLLISNSIGSKHKVRIVKFANCLGIKTVALQSEGDINEKYSEEVIENRFYGWKNREDRLMNEDLLLLWSTRVMTVLEKVINKSNMLVKAAGASGFDRYIFASFMTKEVFASKYGKTSYRKIIGLAGWGFDLFTDENLEYADSTTAEYYKANKDFFISCKDKLNIIYRELIVHNPDILFVLKFHPEDTLQLSEFIGLQEYSNTVSIQREENIADVINVSDIWLAFESTTCLEAWLLGKETILVNPNGDFANRSEISDGILKVETYETLQRLIDQYYTGNDIDPDDIKEKRKETIRNIIEYDDGLNHIRSADHVLELLHKELNKKITNYPYMVECIIREIAIYVICLIPFRYIFKRAYQKIKGIHGYYDKAEREQQRIQYQEWLTEFYRKRNLI